MLRVCFAGITGWTAPPIVAALAAAGDLQLVAAAGRSLAEVTGLPLDGEVHAGVADALVAAPAGSPVDVLVDFTSAQAVGGNVRTAIEAGVHVVVGSSGLTGADYEEIDALARRNGVGVVAAGNFSVMAALLRRAALLAAEHLERWEVIDYASHSKPDVPSGTARELAEMLAGVRRPEPAVPLEDLHGPVEARGAEVEGTRVHSVRLPSFVVSTEIVFGGAGERLVVRHDAGETPDPYAAGTLLAIRRVGEQPGLRRGLDTLLFGTPPA
jgi:4-hydroxy-tetrahydrodipicolinate reductase